MTRSNSKKLPFLVYPNSQSVSPEIVSLLHNSTFSFYNLARAAIADLAGKLKLKNKKILLPSYNCHHTVIPFLGKNKYIFYKINPDLSIDSSSFVEKLKEDPSIVIFVHFFGFADKNFLPLLKLCQNKKITTIEDCSWTFLSKHKGKYLGKYADFGIFSFRKFFQIPVGALLLDNKRRVLDNNDFIDYSDAFTETESDFLNQHLQYYNMLNHNQKYSEALKDYINRMKQNAKIVKPHRYLNKETISLFLVANYKHLLKRQHNNYKELYRRTARLKKIKIISPKLKKENPSHISYMIPEDRQEQIVKNLYQKIIFAKRFYSLPENCTDYLDKESQLQHTEVYNNFINVPVYFVMDRSEIIFLANTLKKIDEKI